MARIVSDDRSPFDELLRSPFSDPPATKETRSSSARWPVVAGIALGAVAVLLGYVVATGSESAIAATTTLAAAATTAVPTTSGGAVADAVDFPPGFVPLTEMLAAKPEYTIEIGDDLVVGFTTATRRGFEQISGFDGGDWMLETAAGTEVAATGTAFDYGVPGNFSVRFPAVGGSIPTRVKLVGLWRADNRHGIVDVPWSGPPFEGGGVEIDLGGGISVSLDHIALDENGGEVTWALQGVGGPGGVVQLFISEGGTANPTTIYYDNGAGFDPFGGSRLAGAATDGVVVLSRQETGVDGGTSDRVSIEATVTLVASTPADAEFDLSDLPGLEH